MIARSGSDAVVVFAKAPRAGEVKTRMSPPLTPQQAAQLYAALLDDVLEATAAWARALGLTAVLAVHPPQARGELARRAPSGFRAVAQRGADLGARMEWAAAEAAAGGARRILLRGSDSPVLGAATAATALAALEQVDIALCPDRDGGYGLVALRRPCAGLFSHPMSTRHVLADTLAAASERGLGVRLLEPSFDLDAIGDLRALAAARAAGVADACPRTLAWLDAADAWRLTGTTAPD